MQRVEAPQERHRVLAAMYGVVQKVEQQKGHQEAEPLSSDRPSRQSNAKGRFKLRSEGLRRCEGEAGEDEIEEPHADVAEPPPQRRELPSPPRPAQLRERNKKEASDSDEENYQRCLLARSNTPSLPTRARADVQVPANVLEHLLHAFNFGAGID